jgi:hypothetical protein
MIKRVDDFLRMTKIMFLTWRLYRACDQLPTFVRLILGDSICSRAIALIMAKTNMRPEVVSAITGVRLEGRQLIEIFRKRHGPMDANHSSRELRNFTFGAHAR